jgi:hypothetical protein
MTDVDFDSAGHLLATGTKSVLVVGHPEIRKVRFRHMNNETTHLARNMIRALGTALGPKHGAVFVDSCIADLFEACVSRVEHRQSMVGKSHGDWLHEWIGSIIVAQEVRLGLYAFILAFATIYLTLFDLCLVLDSTGCI